MKKQKKFLAVLSAAAISTMIAAAVSTTAFAKTTDVVAKINGKEVKINFEELTTAYENKAAGLDSELFNKYNEKEGLTALLDDKNGFVDYKAVQEAAEDAVALEKEFDLNKFTETTEKTLADFKPEAEWKDDKVVPVTPVEEELTVESVSAINTPEGDKLEVVLSEVPEEAPTAMDVMVTRTINGEEDESFEWNGGSSSWNEETKTLILSKITPVEATEVEQSVVYSVAYGDTEAKEAEALIVEAVEVEAGLTVESVSAIDANNIKVTFDNEEIVEIELEEALVHRQTEVSFVYNEVEYTATLTEAWVDEDLVAAEELAAAITAAEEAIAALPEEITLEESEAVAAARVLVDAALELDEDAEIEGIEVLEAAEVTIEELEAEEAFAAVVAAAQEAVDELTLASATNVDSQEKVDTATALVQPAKDAIAAITDLDAEYDVTALNNAVATAEDNIAKAEAVLAAKGLVATAQETLLDEDYDAAQEAVDALPNSDAKTLENAKLIELEEEREAILAAVNNATNDLVLYEALNVKPFAEIVKADYITDYNGVLGTGNTKDSITEVIDAIKEINENKAADAEQDLVDAANDAVDALETFGFVTIPGEADESETNTQGNFEVLVTAANDAIAALPEGYKVNEEDELTLAETLQAEVDALVASNEEYVTKVLPVLDAEGAIAINNELKTAGVVRIDNNNILEYDFDGSKTVAELQYEVDVVNAQTYIGDGSDLTDQEDIDKAQELVNYIENRGEEDEDGNLTPDTTKQTLLDIVKAANELPLGTINALETTTNSVHTNIDTLKQYADILGLDLTEFDKLIPNRGVAAINDLIQNKPTDGYTAETLKPVFDEIVATRLVFEESVELFKAAIPEEDGEAEPLKDITYITMLIDQLESVSYEKHSDESIREVRLPELQDLVDRFDALEGKEVVLEDGERATDAQKAVLETIKYTEENSKSSTRTRNALKAALTEVEGKLVEQATPTGFEIVEEDIKITAGEEVEFTIHAVKNGGDEDKVAPFEKFNRTYENVKVELSNDLFFYRDIEFVNGVATVSVPVTKTDVNSILIAEDAFEVVDHEVLTVSVTVNVGELSEIKVSGEKTAELTFTAEDEFGNTITDFKGNKVVMLPEGAESDDADATGKALVNFEGGAGNITLSAALDAGTYTFTVDGHEVEVVVEADEEA